MRNIIMSPIVSVSLNLLIVLPWKWLAQNITLEERFPLIFRIVWVFSLSVFSSVCWSTDLEPGEILV